MNEVNLIGRMVKPAEIRVVGETNKKQASFSVAVNSFSNGKSTAQFFNCVAWERTAEIVEKLGEKGALIAITGALFSSRYQAKDKSWKTTFGVRVAKFEKLSSPIQKMEQEATVYEQSSNIQTIESYEENGMYRQDIELREDDLPF